MRIAGVILAGGRSSRFGREKAVAEFGGQMLIEPVLRVLAHGCEPVAVSAQPGSGAQAFAAARGLSCLRDDADDAPGPLAGVRAGLRWARTCGCAWLATAPCDTPRLPLEMVAQLYAARNEGGAVATTSEGLQPLCALWPVKALERVEGLVGHPPVRAVLDALGAARLMFGEAAAFANLNTPDEHARAQMRPG